MVLERVRPSFFLVLKIPAMMQVMHGFNCHTHRFQQSRCTVLDNKLVQVTRRRVLEARRRRCWSVWLLTKASLCR